MSVQRRSLLAGLLPFAFATHAQADAWAELARPGSIVLFRHATAPGVGDPEGFRLDECATQRNLSDAGRAEARRIGGRFRQNGIRVGLVLTSRWCRTLETAQLAFGPDVRDEPAFDSFFGKDDRARDAQTRRAREILSAWRGPGTLVVVTHQVNITALTGGGAASAEGVVVRSGADGKLQVVATIAP